jgi:Uncharacterized protein conserved in bacteria
MMKFYPLVFAFAGMAMLLSCATQVAPGGGPEDKLPPRVAAVYPAPNTTNHPNELFVKLEFDEWINASVPRSAVSISPPIDKKMRFEVSGKTLVLTSRAVLDTGTTYTVTFAGGIKDLHGNMLATPFQLVFSTGAKIDSLKLLGRVLVSDSLIRKKVYPSIGLFLMGADREGRHYLDKYRDTVTHALDSLPMLTKEPPLFLTRTDSVGNFVLSGLRPGRYRVVAFLDANGNQKIEASSELVGVWTGDLSLDSTTTDTLWVPLADQDTTKLELSSLTQPGASVLEATFTRPVYFDSAFADTSNCKLVGPDKSELYPSYVYLGAASNKPRFYFSKKPKQEITYKFVCAQAKDSLFRPLDTLRNELDWEWQEMAGDTMPPSISKTAIRGKAKAAFPDDSLVFAYDKPVLDSMTEKYFVAINKDTTEVQIKQIDPIRYLVVNEKPWLTDVTVDFLQGYQDTTLAAADSNGVRDTVISLKYRRLLRFETVSKLKLAMLRGKIPGAKGGAKVRLYSIDAKTYSYAVCGTDGSFAFNDIVEGSYFIDYYYAEDGKLTPDAGSLFPFRFGKPWRSFGDTLKVKNGENVLNDLVASPLPALP